MDLQVDALAAEAATKLVGLLTTDGWERAKTALAALWRRGHPQRAGSVDVELAEARDRLLTARQGGDAQVEGHIVKEWEDRLRHLLAGEPELAVELRRLIHEWGATTEVHNTAQAYDQARVYQAGGDMRINEQ